MKLVPLWTDVLVWLLVAVLAGYAWYAHRRPHLAAPWRRVSRSNAGMASLVVIGLFAAVGLTDSIHYHPLLPGTQAGAPPVYSVEARSLLDDLLTPLWSRSEKTYSAPLAIRSYSRETVELPGGEVRREFPRLRYGGRHVADERERDRDVVLTVLQGLAWGAMAWATLAAVWVTVLARLRRVTVQTMARRILRRETQVAWIAVFVTLLVAALIVTPVALLAGGYHVFGTDKVGQDVLYLALKSVRTALVIGTLTTLIMLPFAVLLGIAAGYLRGWVDDVIQYVYTTLNSIPGVLLIAAAVLMMQVYIDSHPERFPTAVERADLRLLFLCMILGVTTWTGLARLLRGEALKLRELEYIQAARAFGVRDTRIITRHILPNVMHIVLISLVMDFSFLVLTEAVLSYIGVGVDPTMNSFGTLINNARLEMARDPIVWWTLAAAFGFMFVLVLSANLFADAVRDAFDPRVRVGQAAAEGAG
ncbi:MAG: ABC transporter permease [Betaproteobacteria bacterium]|nr:ABC transporter permease [Betaproteobacteria bacterium]